MGLNLSNRQIAAELEMNEDSIQEMTTILRNGIVAQEWLKIGRVRSIVII